MFSYIDKVDKKLNRTHRNYFITQGDTFTLTANPQFEVVGEQSAIAKFLFKLGFPHSECNIESLFEKDYYFDEDSGLYILKVLSSETELWVATCEREETPYIYEIEVHYTDGNVETLEKAEFTVESQIKG